MSNLHIKKTQKASEFHMRLKMMSVRDHILWTSLLTYHILVGFSVSHLKLNISYRR